MCLTYGMAWDIRTATILSSQCKNCQWKGVTCLFVKSVVTFCSVINASIYSEINHDKRKRLWGSEILQIPLNVPKTCRARRGVVCCGCLLLCRESRVSVSANLYSWRFALLMSLWFDCTCSSKLQHVSFPVGVGGIWCGTLLCVPCSLVNSLRWLPLLWNRKLFCWEDPAPCLTWWPGMWTASVSNT